MNLVFRPKNILCFGAYFLLLACASNDGTSSGLGPGPAAGGQDMASGGAMPGAGGAATVGMGGSTLPGAGGQLVAAGGAMVAAGGVSVSAGGTMIGMGGAMVAAGGDMVGAGGDMVGAGGDMVGAGGDMVGAGGDMVGAGGDMVGAGGDMMGAGGDMMGAGGDMMGAGGDMVGAGGDMVGAGGDMVGTGGTVAAYWPAAYNPSGAPNPADSGFHARGSNPGACMGCHDGGVRPQLVFGGTVYQADGVTPAANVEIGVSDGNNEYFVYSASTGLYWAEGSSSSIDWTTADIRMRNASGEIPKTASTARSANCDSCHSGGLALTLP